MLTSNRSSISATLGPMPIPAQLTIIGSTGVVDEITGNSGVLIRHPQTGYYQIFTAFGTLCSVDQRAARKYAGSL